MASVNRVATGWQARWRTPDGASRKATFSKRVEATQWLNKVEHGKAVGDYVDPRAGQVTFREYAEQWRASQVHRPGTVERVETTLRMHAYPSLGMLPLRSVQPSRVQAWVKECSTTLAPATVEVAYRYVAAIFRAAVADRLIARTPCVGVRLPKHERGRVEPLAVEVVESIAAAMPQRYSALVVFAAGTGLRQGEAFGVTVDRVDFLRRSLRVDRQLVMTDGTPQFGPLKTAASERGVPLPQVVCDALALHLARFPADPGGLVFTNDDRGPIRRNRFGEVWRSALETAGVAGATFHSLRHFYASLLIRHGESVKVVQSRLGHANASETLDTYSHLWPDSEDRTRTAVDLVLGVVPDEQAAAT